MKRLFAVLGTVLLMLGVFTSSAQASDMYYRVANWGTYICADFGHKGYLNHCDFSGDKRDVNKYLWWGNILPDCAFDISGSDGLNVTCGANFHANYALSYPEAVDFWCVIKDGSGQADGGNTQHVGAYHVQVVPAGSDKLVDTDLYPTKAPLNVHLDDIGGIGSQAVVQCFMKFWIDTGLVHPPAQTYAYHIFLPKLLKLNGQWMAVGADALPGNNGSAPGGQTHVTEWYNDQAQDNWPWPGGSHSW